ncbi:hypothetical protein PV08_09837 [Exophiala spinifera]|uniref:Zn(2)-C6 fungal-type domain-containing protein n=1 Tax=Exophiala spinifera TaxID=91928 RepID=A0A0D2B1S6_9EURO|nr:uncharacterized protein PV08_09837 [Exophiala spinifera]KIW12560.1 hypothetical protein PV08_09837 [Exophiala spinifera]
MPPARQPKVRSRTFTSCLECRRRKVKCDLSEPSCNNCLRLGLTCPGFSIQLHWLPKWQSGAYDKAKGAAGGDEIRRARTDIFGTRSGLQFSEDLIQQLSESSRSAQVDEALETLETRVRESAVGLDRQQHWQMFEGPFSVFCPPLSMETLAVKRPKLATPRLPNNDSSATLWLSNDDWFSAVPDEVFPNDALTADLLDFDLGDALSSIEKSSSLDFEHAFQSGSYGDRSSEDKPQYIENAVDKFFASNAPGALSSFYGHPSATSLPNGSPYLPHNVRFLLSHYTSHVIDSLSLLPTNQAPYRGIHMPYALTAYGELDIMGQSGFARVSLLYSLLSLTCYHLSSLYEPSSGGHRPEGSHPNPSNSRYWSSQGLKFRDIARTSFRKCLQAMVSDPSFKVKYKELFVGAMSLICTGIISGDPWDARFFILQCEDIVNRIGRTKRRFSDKALQLHRIFSYIRIIEQTTFVQTRDQYLDTLDKHALFPEHVEMVKQIPHDTFSHSATVARNLQTMSDLGLTGPEEETFYELYGIPGSLMRLIARTNNLIADIDPPELHGTSPPAMPPSVVEAAAALENDICRFQLPKTGDAASSGRGTDLATTVNPSEIVRSHIGTAIHHALLVYFFRFVRGTNPIILQHYVESILSNLESHQASKHRFFVGARLGTTVWPSFIAACEALGDDLRHRAVVCMRHATWAGFKNAEAAEVVAREVWRRRDAGENDVSWSTVLRESRTILLLT